MTATTPSPFTALLDEIASRYPVASRTERRVCLAWPAEGAREPQTLQAEALWADGLHRLALTADICRVERASPSEALELAAKLITGTLLSRDGFISVRHIFTEARTDAADVYQGVVFLRDAAIEFRRLLLKWDPLAKPPGAFLID